MSTPSLDYGEPWYYDDDLDLALTRNNSAGDERRIVDCVNACRGMADPAAEIQAMREAIKNFCKEQEWAVDAWKKQAHVAALFELAKLQPFIKP